MQELALVKTYSTGLRCEASLGTVGKSPDSGIYVACRDEWILASRLHLTGDISRLGASQIGDRLADYWLAEGISNADFDNVSTKQLALLSETMP